MMRQSFTDVVEPLNIADGARLVTGHGLEIASDAERGNRSPTGT